MMQTVKEAPAGEGAANGPDSSGGLLRRHDWQLQAARFTLPAIFIAIVIFFSIAVPDTFPTSDNFKSIVNNESVLGILAISLILPLVIGEFDLSVGANLGLAAILVTGLPAKSGVALAPAIAIAICASGLVGLFNGVVVAKIGVNSLVATLGTASIVTGAVAWYTEGKSIFEGIPQSLPGIAKDSVLGVPLPGVYLLLVALAAWFVLEQTALGRYLYAVGGSKAASRLSGLNVDRLAITAFTGAGVLAGVAGVVEAALLGSGQPSTGPGFLLPAFATVFLGATTIRLGTFNVIGTVIALFTLATAITGLQLMGVASYVAPIFQGVALLVAVSLVMLLKREAF
jgi:ribose transport system permease protein